MNRDDRLRALSEYLNRIIAQERLQPVEAVALLEEDLRVLRTRHRCEEALKEGRDAGRSAEAWVRLNTSLG